MKKYRCKEPLMLERYDNEGYCMVGQTMTVQVGTVMEISANLEIAAPPSVRLEGCGMWLEIGPETLKKHFEEVT